MDRPGMLHFLGPLRFLAAAWVVWFHFGKGIVADGPELVQAFRAHGFLGVPLFFLLSGYVLAHRYEDGKVATFYDAWRFWVKRFARVYPLYLLSIGLAAWFIAVHHGWSQYFTNLSFAQILLLQSWSGVDACEMNCPAWSISVEAHLYLLFPFLVAVLARWPRVFGAAAATWAALLVAIGWLHMIGAGPFHPYELRFMPVMHVLSFSIGIVLQRRRTLLERIPAPVYLVLGLLSLAAVLAWGGANNEDKRVLLNNIGAVPSMALIVIGTAQLQAPLPAVAARVLALLGDLSYGVYILQYSVQRLLAHYFPWTGQPALSTSHGFVFMGLTLVLASYLTYHIIERPARGGLTRLLLSPRPPARHPVPVDD